MKISGNSGGHDITASGDTVRIDGTTVELRPGQTRTVNGITVSRDATNNVVVCDDVVNISYGTTAIQARNVTGVNVYHS